MAHNFRRTPGLHIMELQDIVQEVLRLPLAARADSDEQLHQSLDAPGLGRRFAMAVREPANASLTTH